MLVFLFSVFAACPGFAKENKDNKKQENLKAVKSKARRVYKNNKGYWEAEFDCGIKMVYIPSGEFLMGQTGEEKKWLLKKIDKKEYDKYYKTEKPAHKVYLNFANGCPGK